MRPRLFDLEPKFVRETLNLAVEKSDQIHFHEKELLVLLKKIDQKRLFIRFGYNSLTGFCNFGLKFSRTQTHRIVTEVRRMV